MQPEVKFDRSVTDYDLNFFAAIERALKPQQQPENVISIEAYCSLRDANDCITRNNFILRTQRARLVLRLRRIARIRYRLNLVCSGLIALAVLWGGSWWLRL